MSSELIRLSQETYKEINCSPHLLTPAMQEFYRRRTELVTFGEGVKLNEQARIEGLQQLLTDVRASMQNL